MDPLTALSLAGTIVQFVDFGSKLVSRSQELYRSSNGSLTVNEELDLVTQTLLKIVAKLQRPQGSEVLTGSGADDYSSLVELCCSCTQVAEDIIAKLENLKITGKPRRWRTLKHAIKSCWTEKDLDALFKRLSMLRQALETHVMVELREKVETQALQSCSRFDHLDSKTQEIITVLIDSQSVFSSDLEEQILTVSRMLDRMEVVVVEQHDKTRAIVVDLLQQTLGSVVQDPESRIQKVMDDIQDEEDRLRTAVGKQILKSLYFLTIMGRQEAIPEAHAKTFDWIFQEPTSQEMEDSFVEWLKSGSGIYWINGKAGSGKSTLMRYLYENPLTMENLKHWSGSSSLCIAAFFFWGSGMVEQKSQSGLLRSLLYEVLRQHPDLIPVVLPRDWAKRYTCLIDTIQPERDIWSLTRLKRAFQLLSRQDIVKIRLCLFIDGLDEYDGDHDEVAQIFESFTTSPCIKVCLSSRPLVLFGHVFQGSPCLRLQDLTVRDIQYYVADTLEHHRQFQRLALKQPRRTSDLVNEIVRKAEGVFLWVSLVVKSLLSGLSNRDDMRDLQRRVRLLPSDLEALYSHMLACIDPFYARKASEIFQIERSARDYLKYMGPRAEEPVPLTLLGLSFAIDESDLSGTNSVPFLEGTPTNLKLKTVEDRLKGQCAGLLETQTSSTEPLPTRKVQYLHRTVQEYLERSSIWETVVSRTAGTTFNPNISMLRSCVFQLKATPSGQITQSFWRLVLAALLHAHHASNETDRSHFVLIDELDQTIASHMIKTQMIQEEDWTSDWTFYLQKELRISFMNVAVRFGLHGYVREKLDYGFEETELSNG
ncbi:hypothetical protein BDZ45DRAFT_696655 [Acephala macrosclerotiorum]|nr:hypothetical protein BDZ45DRAFT_696655 [Acephala macrosclerotiorum]